MSPKPTHVSLVKTQKLYHAISPQKCVLPAHLRKGYSPTLREYITGHRRERDHTLPTSQLFLDDGHLDWMSDRILQHVLADLRPKILPKIKVEARVLLGSGEKQGTVDVHRGGARRSSL
jgi:hypothetical protein